MRAPAQRELLETWRARVPSEQLLEFNVKEGWAPLCAFLRKEIPPEPFPQVNESADLQFAAKVMVGLSYAWLPALAVAACAVRAGVDRLRRGP